MMMASALPSLRAGVANRDGDEAQEPIEGDERERGQQRGRILGPQLRWWLLNIQRQRVHAAEGNGVYVINQADVPLEIDRLINNINLSTFKRIS